LLDCRIVNLAEMVLYLNNDVQIIKEGRADRHHDVSPIFTRTSRQLYALELLDVQ